MVERAWFDPAACKGCAEIETTARGHVTVRGADLTSEFEEDRHVRSDRLGERLRLYAAYHAAFVRYDVDVGHRVADLQAGVGCSESEEGTDENAFSIVESDVVRLV